MVTIITFSSALFWFFFFFVFSFLSLKTISQPRVSHLLTFCNNQSDSFTRHSSYHSNRAFALTSLRSSSSVIPPIYLSVTKGLSPDTVYTMYLCRGDVTKSTCSICVRTASLELSKTCDDQKEGFIYYEECMVRYSDYSFVGLLEGPNFLFYSANNFSTTSRFGEILTSEMDKLITRAASTTSLPKPYFAQDKQRLTEFGSSYTLDTIVQCSLDLNPRNCTGCLKLAVKRIMDMDCCTRSRSVHNFRPKCLIKYHTTSLPANVPSFGVIKETKIFGRICITGMTASMLALVGL